MPHHTRSVALLLAGAALLVACTRQLLEPTDATIAPYPGRGPAPTVPLQDAYPARPAPPPAYPAYPARPATPPAYPAPTQGAGQPYPPPGDREGERSPVYLDSSDVLLLESDPVQVRLVLRGSLPTPCHELRTRVSEPDEQNRIEVEVYSLADPDVICAQMLATFEEQVPLGSFADGTYSVWVNSELAGEFSLP